MSKKSPPFSVFFDLAGLGDAGADVTLAPGQGERAAIADFTGIGSLESLVGRIRLSKLGGGFFAYEATFTADAVQACVVTLEPVRSRIAREFRRVFQVSEPRRKAASPKLPAELPESAMIAQDEEAPEELDGPLLDIAAPVLEELSLAIDPYPRIEGAQFAATASGEDSKDSPFAVLEKLKTKP